MSKTELSSNKLFVVRPSVVVFDDTEYSFRKTMDRTVSATMPVTKRTCRQAKKVGVELQPTGVLSNINWCIQQVLFERAKNKNVNHVNHIVRFENRIQDTTIATQEAGICRDVASDRIFYPSIGSHLCECEMCVGVLKNDKVLLARYLWERSVQDTKYNNEIERYVLSLKPFYTMEEITDILEQLKSEVVSRDKEEPKVFTLKRKSKQPIFAKGVYTDPC